MLLDTRYLKSLRDLKSHSLLSVILPYLICNTCDLFLSIFYHFLRIVTYVTAIILIAGQISCDSKVVSTNTGPIAQPGPLKRPK